MNLETTVNYDWQEVPYDWDSKYCPDLSVSNGVTAIEVVERDGNTYISEWISSFRWVQDYSCEDIVRFRKLPV